MAHQEKQGLKNGKTVWKHHLTGLLLIVAGLVFQAQIVVPVAPPQIANGGVVLIDPVHPAPFEATVLLPKFECVQNPQTSLCCPKASSAILNAQGCCTAHQNIISKRGTQGMDANQIAQTPFSSTEHTQYVNGCCDGLGQKQEACCKAAMTPGSDLSVCATIPTTPPTPPTPTPPTPTPPTPTPPVTPSPGTPFPTGAATLTCKASDSANEFDYHGRQAISRYGKNGPVEVTLEVVPHESVPNLNKSILLEQVMEMELVQVGGSKVVTVPGSANPDAGKALETSKALSKNLAVGGGNPSSEFKFIIPDESRMGEEEFKFTVVAKTTGGQPKFAASGSCLIVANAEGGGCGCRLEGTSSQLPSSFQTLLTMGSLVFLGLLVFRTKIGSL